MRQAIQNADLKNIELKHKNAELTLQRDRAVDELEKAK